MLKDIGFKNLGLTLEFRFLVGVDREVRVDDRKVVSQYGLMIPSW